ERIIRQVLTENLGEHRARREEQPPTAPVSDDVRLLFETRYMMEVELRRIAQQADFLSSRPMVGLRLAERMSRAGILPSRLFDALREVYAVCSPAIHGERVS